MKISKYIDIQEKYCRLQSFSTLIQNNILFLLLK